MIVLKLIAGRILDRVDVAELLKANRNHLDMNYLAGWVRALHLERMFGRSLDGCLSRKHAPT